MHDGAWSQFMWSARPCDLADFLRPEVYLRPYVTNSSGLSFPRLGFYSCHSVRFKAYARTTCQTISMRLPAYNPHEALVLPRSRNFNMKLDFLPCKTPIAFMVFNRPEHTLRAFRRIAEVKPTHLLVIADGARADRPGESELCEQVRAIATQVDWACTLQTNFADTNMGCRKRIVSGLNWVFEQVEQAIILEDDVLPDLSFFLFCQQMLARHAEDRRISMIGGFSPEQDRLSTSDSYYYSHLSHIWGWATWRWSWARYDEHLTHWPEIKAAGLLRNVFKQPYQYQFWTHIFDQMHSGTGPNTWDYQWVYSNLVNNALSVIPHINLVENIGFGPSATHTTQLEHAPLYKGGSLTFPLHHPVGVVPRLDLDELDDKLSGNKIPSIPKRALRKAGRLLRGA